MPSKLLLADDSVTIQRVIELTFADEDIQVTSVGNGRDAIQRLEAEGADIVLADVGMPERDGYEVAAFVKGDPRYAHVPVLLLTGAFEPIDESRARAVQCDGVLVKPFEPQMVISRVRELLSRGAQAAPQAESPAAAPSHESLIDPPPAVRAVAPRSSEDYFDRLEAAFATGDPSLRPTGLATDARSGWTSPAHVPGGLPTGLSPGASMMEAFAALLTAEQGTPVLPAAAAIGSIGEDVIDEIARRVIARLGEAPMRQAVLDTAERLVRAEIERIKQNAR
jgi:CheY-like chemotaxis protein